MFSKKIKFVFIASVLAAALFFFNKGEEMRKINPPNLTGAHLGKKIVCHRPMRHGSPNMSVEKKGEKIIGHNYGHGGSGWTLGPGSANHVINLLLSSEHANDMKKDTPITVIGAGALGLFSAYYLEKMGYTDITIVAEKFESLTSHNAAGLLAPVSMDNDPEMQKLVNQIGIDAYKFYESIANKSHNDFKDGAVVLPTYFENREDSGLEPYVGVVMKPAKDVVLDFGNGTTRKMVAYDDGIFIDTAKMMIGLSRYLKSKNIKFVQRRVTTFDDVEGKFIINCSGLGAGNLNGDASVVSVQGHLIMLKEQVPADLQYMILVYFNEAKTKSGQKVKRSFYVFPKHLPNTGANDIGVIGGTFIEGANEDTLNEEEFEIMLAGAKNFYGIK